MDLLIRDALIIERTLCDLASFYGSNNTLRTLMAFDRERSQFLLLDEGWDGHRRVHVVWAHVELRDDKMWIQEDGTEQGIANLLVKAGITHDRIVLAFHAPSQRRTGEFAVA